jgi:hypothetical protein
LSGGAGHRQIDRVLQDSGNFGFLGSQLPTLILSAGMLRVPHGFPRLKSEISPIDFLTFFPGEGRAFVSGSLLQELGLGGAMIQESQNHFRL